MSITQKNNSPFYANESKSHDSKPYRKTNQYLDMLVNLNYGLC
jgi:hypothetical protein